jgi:hypothetical protein
LKVGLTGCPETSASIYLCTLRNISEERRYNLHRDGSLKSCVRFGHQRKHTASAHQNQQQYSGGKPLFLSSKNRWRF